MIRSLIRMFGACLLAALMIGVFIGGFQTPPEPPVHHDHTVGVVIAHIYNPEFYLIIKPAHEKDTMVKVSQTNFRRIHDGDTVILVETSQGPYVLSTELP